MPDPPTTFAEDAAAGVLEGFQFPEDARAPAFARAQAELRRRAAPALLHRRYAMPIQEYVRAGEALEEAIPATPPLRRRGATVARAGAAAWPTRPREVDVLLCGVWAWERPQETAMWMRLLAGLLGQGKRVLCLTRRGGARWQAARRLAASHAGPGRAEVLDVRGLRGRLAERFGWHMARERGRRDLERVRAVLRPHGLRLDRAALSGFIWNAARALDWQAWAPHVTFERAVVFCHWLPLCNAVVRTAFERGKRVTAFQQGVVSHSIDVPLRAHTFVCFGDASARLLRRMDAAARRVQQGGRAAPRAKAANARLLRAGALFDPVLDLKDNFEQRTVLVFDQSLPWAMSYYGLDAQQAALERLLQRLLEERTALRRLVVRLHPGGGERARYEALAEAFPGRVVLSESAQRPFPADLRRASVALGLFSGALATAAACGLPTLFLTAPGGFRTPDLDCFERQHAGGEAAFERLARLLGERAAYEKEQATALAAARTYYAGGAACRFAPSFVQKLLEDAP